MSVHVQVPDSIKKLAAAHQDLMLFFNAMDEVFFSVDMINLKVIQISSGCEKLYGHKASEFLQNNRLWFELIHPEDKDLLAGEEELLQRGEKVSKQYRIIHKDGSVRWVENKVIPCLDETGRLTRVDGITRDITDSKEAEEKHRQSEAWYRQIVESAQEGIWTIDENEKTNFVNKKMADILGYSPNEMLGKELYDFMDDEGKAYAIACMERRRRGSKENLDIRYKTKTGEDVWANISANPIIDETGKYKGALAMVTDITQRKLDEEAIKKSEANLRTIFNNTDSSYILFDANMNILSFNALAERYSIQQNGKKLKVGAHVRDYFTAERWPFIKEMLDKVAKDEMISYEISYQRGDGTTQWNNVRWLNVKAKNNQNWGFILANKDITETKTAALERERITADLIQHIKDLEQFTYIVSHNLRAPVANIIGLSEMLMEEDLSQAEKLEVVERVSLSIKNMDTVIQDLNHILQARELSNEKKEKVDFADLVNAIKTSINNTVVGKKVRFNCQFEVEAIFSIRSYLYSILYNLSSNSIKYCKAGVAPVITIESRQLKNQVELRFKDNGKGIDLHKNASELFGLYKRFDTTTEGKGMGLFMVKTQVEAIGGTIKVKSKLGEGTEFVMRFAV
ncbi:PAS domain-containing sensor histidine kinase [Mucilaginibacter sp.]|uniref:PAS domain-containing sensor histidine kinase n=1 Tax=Mucilaginibacter sp. TaxID=1882438 RepID=UPI00284C3D69|nr:PAS domain-containing sensor histidine kinase [Mucilaginibacter sp.]MDR3697971.1 PAS domain-containing sensor histidine kinase [Mucilaginibacter sp.]